jgi:hypothetical protein
MDFFMIDTQYIMSLLGSALFVSILFNVFAWRKIRKMSNDMVQIIDEMKNICYRKMKQRNYK